MNEIQNEIRRNAVLTDVQNVLIEQTKKGLEKYGTTVHYPNLSATEWIEHAKEETADKLVYLTCLEKSIQLMEIKTRAFDAIWHVLEDYHNAGILSEKMAIDAIHREIEKVFEQVREGEQID